MTASADDQVASVTFENDDDRVVVIVGSGAGGGTLANELCQKGIDVVILEAGPRFTLADFRNDEATAEPFHAAAPHLVHFHANEPDLGVLGTSGDVDHRALGGFLRDIGYQEFVSIEQRMLNADHPVADVARSARVLTACYQ